MAPHPRPHPTPVSPALLINEPKKPASKYSWKYGEHYSVLLVCRIMQRTRFIVICSFAQSVIHGVLPIPIKRQLDSLVPGRCSRDPILGIFKVMSGRDILSISCDIVLVWKALDTTDVAKPLPQPILVMFFHAICRCLAIMIYGFMPTNG